jgi:hypothetical protein
MITIPLARTARNLKSQPTGTEHRSFSTSTVSKAPSTSGSTGKKSATARVV